MSFPFRLSALAACAVLLAVPQGLAADLGVRPSRIGAIFAEPPIAPRARFVETDVLIVVPPILPTSPKVPGYYGRAGDFEYRNYYGTPPETIFSRLPYACGFVGLC